MEASPVDTRMAMDQAAQNDLVHRKMEMDSLRNRLGDNTSKEAKLRESCEGFEAIFIQKMWEEMRKNIGKGGYLHGKDEETYQSMFDVELSKKMTSAGGIGLADMLYDQLSQKLTDTGRTTSPSTYRNPAPLAPVKRPQGAGEQEAVAFSPENSVAAASQGKPVSAEPVGKPTLLKVENLYSALPEGDIDNQTDASPVGHERNSSEAEHAEITKAIEELRSELAPASQFHADAPGTSHFAVAASQVAPLAPPTPPIAVSAPQVAEGAAPQKTQTNMYTAPLTVTQAAAEHYGKAVNAGDAASVASPVSKEISSKASSQSLNMGDSAEKSRNAALSSSWQGAGPVSAKPKPVNLFGRDRNKKSTPVAPASADAKAATPSRAMAPQETLWPVADSTGKVVSSFGWEDDPTTGKRRWNPGVEIAAGASAPVRASLDGTVIFSGVQEGYGNLIVLEHKDGFRSYYGNIDSISVKEGENVSRGTVFAKTMGNPSATGGGENSTPLHFEFKRGEMALNPESAILRMTTAGK